MQEIEQVVEDGHAALGGDVLEDQGGMNQVNRLDGMEIGRVVQLDVGNAGFAQVPSCEVHHGPRNVDTDDPLTSTGQRQQQPSNPAAVVEGGPGLEVRREIPAAHRHDPFYVIFAAAEELILGSTAQL
jgi:hypothetical protein